MISLARKTLITLFVTIFAGCDLPIHATLDEIIGTWNILYSGSSKSPVSCGSNAPNRNEDNVVIEDFEKWLQVHYGKENLKSMNVRLTDTKIDEEPMLDLSEQRKYNTKETLFRKGLEVKDNAGKLIGLWTMIYDEGLEIRHFKNKMTFTGFFKYRKTNNAVCKNIEGGNEKNNDSENTLCYHTDPHKTHIGWYSFDDSKGETRFGCWFGHWDSSNRERPEIEGSSMRFVSIKSKKKEKTQKFQNEIDNVIMNYPMILSVLRRGKAFFGEYFQNYTKNSVGYPCQRTSTFKALRGYKRHLPRSFSAVDNPFAQATYSTMMREETSKVINQMDCGACYAAAATYVLKYRALYQLGKMDQAIHSRIDIPDLSFQSVLSCSFYSQGCDGGFPFLVGKWAKENGIPSTKCMNFKNTDREACEYPSESVECSKNNSVFARDYGYIGGCYECCSEKKIMENIMEKGPLVAALDIPPFLFNLSSEIARPFGFNKHSKQCDDPGKGLNGWEYTNHAVAIVGWGEDSEENTKYWIIRNSWGPRWGREGFGRVLRGVDAFGIESQAVFIDPDFSRGIFANKNILTGDEVNSPGEKIELLEANQEYLGFVISSHHDFVKRK